MGKGGWGRETKVRSRADRRDGGAQNHTMIRVKDAEKSLKYYQEVLGMSLLRTIEQSAAGFNLYFLGYPGTKGIPEDGFTSDREGLLELTWNYGTEKDENFKYHDGNAEPQGFGHICEFFFRFLLPFIHSISLSVRAGYPPEKARHGCF